MNGYPLPASSALGWVKMKAIAVTGMSNCKCVDLGYGPWLRAPNREQGVPREGEGIRSWKATNIRVVGRMK